MHTSCLGLIAGLIVALPASARERGMSADATIPITVAAVVERPESPQEGLELIVTIRNDTAGEISFQTFSLTPNAWNGETSGLRLLDLYRDGVQRERVLAHPKVEVPSRISGMGGRRIKSGDTLTVRTDATKWTIDGGWTAGQYEGRVRVESLIVDEGRCRVAVYSDYFRFEIPPSAIPVAPAPTPVAESDAPWALSRISFVRALRESLHSGTPIERSAALALIRELKAIELVPDVIRLIDDPTSLPRDGDTGWGFVGHQAASLMSELATAIDRVGSDARATPAYYLHDDQHKGGEALRDSGRLKEVRLNWENWWKERRSDE